MKRPVVAVVGATGAVGLEMINILEQRNFPLRELHLVASERSAGKTLRFRGKDLAIEVLSSFSFKGIDLVLSSPGASVSKGYVPGAVSEGAVVIDNTSAFRMEPDVPLVVPEVNPEKISEQRGIISNPNCSTIQLVVALKPIHNISRIRRIVISTYQAASGAGSPAVDELKKQTSAALEGSEITPGVFPHRIAFNVLPHIDIFLDNAYTREEMKLVQETRKIMADESIRITATAVRVPVFVGHSESVNIETEGKLSPQDVREILSKSAGVVVVDKPEDNLYPLAVNAAGKDEVFVGRIREDESIENGLNMWIVSDNLRKGAALNAIQIAEHLLRGGYEEN